MKKLIIISLLVLSLNIYSQNEGTAIYDMQIEGLPHEQASMMGDMTMKVVWKNDKIYSEQSSMMYEIKSVTDEKGTLILMDQMGNKYYMKIDANDPKYKEKENNTPEYKIEYKNDTKKIAGYDCKKAIIKMKTKDNKDILVDVWYTDEIPNIYNKQKYSSEQNENTKYLREIPGMLLEYIVPQEQFTIRLTAKEVNFNHVPDNIFNLSTNGYTEINPDQLKRK